MCRNDNMILINDNPRIYDINNISKEIKYESFALKCNFKPKCRINDGSFKSIEYQCIKKMEKVVYTITVEEYSIKCPKNLYLKINYLSLNLYKCLRNFQSKNKIDKQFLININKMKINIQNSIKKQLGYFIAE